MADPKLLAEWFWVDRWTGSSAFGLTIEARGLYREMLSQAWRRGAKLPVEPETIRRFTGCTLEEWDRCWPYVRVFWEVRDGVLVNATQLDVYARAMKGRTAAETRGKKGAEKRWGDSSTSGSTTSSSNAQASAQAVASYLLSPISTKNKRSPSPAAPSCARFDAFWKAYPKKVGKDDARKAFARRKVDDGLLELMLSAIETQQRSKQWQDEGGRFIPHAATWLNRGQWQDEGSDVAGPRPVGAVRHWTPDDCPHDEKHWTQVGCEHAMALEEFRASRLAAG